MWSCASHLSLARAALTLCLTRLPAAGWRDDCLAMTSPKPFRCIFSYTTAVASAVFVAGALAVAGAPRRCCCRTSARTLPSPFLLDVLCAASHRAAGGHHSHEGCHGEMCSLPIREALGRARRVLPPRAHQSHPFLSHCALCVRDRRREHWLSCGGCRLTAVPRHPPPPPLCRWGWPAAPTTVVVHTPQHACLCMTSCWTCCALLATELQARALACTHLPALGGGQAPRGAPIRS